MTKREVVFFTCRILAIYFLIDSISQIYRSTQENIIFVSSLFTIWRTGIPSGITTYTGMPVTPTTLVGDTILRLSLPFIYGFTALGLWIFSRDIAIRFFDTDLKEDSDTQNIVVVPVGARAIAFSCLGLFFLFQDIPKLILWIMAMFWDMVRFSGEPLPFGYGFSWDWLVRIPLSLWLIFGWRGLAGLWRLAQEKGTPSR